MSNPQVQYREGFIERWSGKLLRWLMAYLFVVGVGLFVGVWYLWLTSGDLFDVGQLTRAAWLLGVTVALMVPYLAIRYRDPTKTTIPLAAYVN